MLKTDTRACLGLIVVVATTVFRPGSVGGATVQTRGAGTAVTSVDRLATFDALTFGRDIALSDYTEAGLFVGMNGDSWTINPNSPSNFDPFGGTNPSRAFYATYDGAKGTAPTDPNDWTIIRTTDSRKIFGVEFMYGNSWTTGGNPAWGNVLAHIEWQTKTNGVTVSSGIDGDPAVSILPLGTVLGFFDPAGFDELWVRCVIPSSGNTNLQALALDNLAVMLTNIPPAPVITGSDFSVNLTNGVPALTVYDTIAGCQYRLVYTESLSAPLWSPVNWPLPDGWQAGGGTLNFTDPGAPGRPQRFYRVQAQ